MGDSTMSHEIEQRFLDIENRLDELETKEEGSNDTPPARRASKKATTTPSFVEDEETS